MFIEYPPFALVFFTLPRVIGASFRWYYVWYQVEVVVADLVVLALLYAARERGSAPWRVLLPYTALVLAVGPIALQQYDLFPAALTLVAVVASPRGATPPPGSLLALATMTKVYPALLAPVFLLLDDAPRSSPRIRRAAAVFAATCVIVLRRSSSSRRQASVACSRFTQNAAFISIACTRRSHSPRGRAGIGLVNVTQSFRSVSISGTGRRPGSRVDAVLAAALVGAYAFIGRRSRRLAPAATTRRARS